MNEFQITNVTRWTKVQMEKDSSFDPWPSSAVGCAKFKFVIFFQWLRTSVHNRMNRILLSSKNERERIVRLDEIRIEGI